ncbi:MAG TPA: MoaD/ThiS family protein [Spirochaetia bacterium]|nr:MoaD/ThiS family protein [Spirochaetia bacterium]
MSVPVHVSTHLHSYTGGLSTIEADGATLAELLVDLDRRYPGLRFRVVDEQDRVRRHMNFFVGGEMTRSLDQRIEPNQEVHILGALSGG